MTILFAIVCFMKMNVSIKKCRKTCALKRRAISADCWNIPSIPALRCGTAGPSLRCCCPATTATWTTGGRRKATNAPCAAARTCSPNSTRASSPPSTTARSCSRPRRSCGRSRNLQRMPNNLTAQHNNAAIKCTPLSDSGVHFISSYGSLC